MKVKDVIKELPEETDGLGGYNHGFSQARNIILNSEIDISKVIDVEKVKEEVKGYLQGYLNSLALRHGLLPADLVSVENMGIHLAQAILTNLNKCGK